jgi:predicted N-acetyltransferase YhbS
MVFRQARPNEMEELFREGYRVWSRNRTYEQYCTENRKEDAYGTRFVLEVDSEVVSSLILLKLKDCEGMTCRGIGSVVTPQRYCGKGYATALVRNCVAYAESGCGAIFLYSDIDPGFYERFGFTALPDHLQKKKGSVCMVRCKEDVWKRISGSTIDKIPAYF